MQLQDEGLEEAIEKLLRSLKIEEDPADPPPDPDDMSMPDKVHV